jgi:hypothetical protein
LTGVFHLLDKGFQKRGMGAVICLEPDLSAIDRSMLIIPLVGEGR